MKIKHIITLALSLFSLVLFSQESVRKIYASKEYSKAAKTLELKESRSVADMEKIANSYRLNHDTETAAFWYKQIIEKSNDPKNYLYYAQALQSNGDYEQAKHYYLAYHSKGKETQDKRGMKFAEAINRLKDFKMPGKVVVENLKELNSEKIDFSPTITKEGVVFVSSRAKDNTGSFHDHWIDDSFMNLFFASYKEGNKFGAVEKFSNTLNSDFHEGPISFVKSEKQIYFSRNQNNKGKRVNAKDGLMKNDIYTSFEHNGTWSEAIDLPFNTKNYEEVHPSVSPDGEMLVFASDRPGGMGGMDLYVVTFKGGEFSEPLNLGPKVNTAGNELFPYIHDDGTFYFASDGLPGLGGLDVFKSRLIGRAAIGAHPENIGSPINSIKDDFGLVMNITGTEGYFTSAREGGLGKDDIYHFLTEEASEEDVSNFNTFCFYDESSGKRLPNVRVSIFELDPNGGSSNIMKYFDFEKEQSNSIPNYSFKPLDEIEKPVEYLKSGEGGDIRLQVLKSEKYVLKAERNGYEIVNREFEVTEDGAFDINTCIPLKKNSCLTVNGKVINAVTKRPIPFATIEVLEACLGDKITITADGNGNYSAPCAACDCEFIVKGEKSEYMNGEETTGLITSKCTQGGTVTVDIFLEPKNKPRVEKPRVVEGPRVVVGTSLELKNIFYDFNEFYIRKEAASDLNELADILKSYPSMVIELSSHTDSRGADYYNDLLSQNRADAAVEYLANKGIARRRMVARGFGENKLRNRCADGTKCSELEHQFNRRTEVKILRLDEDVDIRQMDNFPIIIDEAPRHLQQSQY